MAGLKTLVRLTRFRLDEMRQALSALHAESDAIRRLIAGLEEEVRAEMEVARTSEESRMMLGAYLHRTRLERARLDHALADVEARIAATAEALAEAFREQKRYELVMERRAEEERREEARRETAFLDETGAQGFIRRSRGDADV
jgi:flagellar export protein FliJ